MADRLRSYRAKRDFGASSEPAGGGVTAPGGGAGGRFVVQEHRARNLHWDLRLEHDGVAVSWALPRGVPAHPDENRLAVHTEDHPLEYLEWEGEIPKGEYGAGTMRVWDSGTYAAEKFRDDEVIATFDGEHLRGRYALFQTSGKNWMIHRMDPPEQAGYEPFPQQLTPMLARTGSLPRDEQHYGFEVKWDGIRALLYSDHGHLTLQGRNFTDFTPRYPELRELSRELGARRLVLDGEVVAFDEQGRPSFERLQTRMHLASDSQVKRRMRDTPVTYVIFDLLYLDGHSTLSLTYEQRRELLERLELDGPSWRTPAYHRGEGGALLDATAQHGIEGVVAKRLDCPYEPGRRSSAWIKVKNVYVQDVVIGGWTPGEGKRAGQLGALTVGVIEDGHLRYAGKVGTGFTDTTLSVLQRTLEPLRSDRSPFDGRQPPKGTIFVRPEQVASVEFREWTRSGTLRAPSFKGLRPDKDPSEAVREPQVPARGEG
jgi:bifunctional non-homologous end joining protein LigD